LAMQINEKGEVKMSVFDVLKERGFIESTTHEDELREYLAKPPASCYIGFDPTASSLHVGSLVPIMSLAHMQRCGHKPIALVGGGTGMIGDPSGKTEMRQLLTPEIIEENKRGIKGQLARFIDFNDGGAELVDNADWLLGLEYISFLRDIGRHFSVNRMIKAESYKMRLESDEGLAFIEFNYMILQAYDFLKLSETHNCMLQMGGSDQWGNIVAGVDLVRRVSQKQAFGITFPLITTSSGIKMGKTHKGAVWLDPERTTPYEYYQFWVNSDDQDVERFLALFTFLPMDEIREVKKLEGADLNSVKSILAYEATMLAHGKQAADDAVRAAASLFGGRTISADILPSSQIERSPADESASSVPTSEILYSDVLKGINVVDLLYSMGLVKSKGEARRMIEQGGVYLNSERALSVDDKVTEGSFKESEILVRLGKKRYHKIIFKKSA